MLNDAEHEQPTEITEHSEHLAQPILELNRLIHEPARLAILAVLDAAEEVDFKFLLAATGLTRGNLSRQATKLEEAGYIQIHKYHKGKIPATSYRITPTGQSAFVAYRDQIQRLLHPSLQLVQEENPSNTERESQP
jgi:DNA-binding transcriptional ArsR family regulator